MSRIVRRCITSRLHRRNIFIGLHAKTSDLMVSYFLVIFNSLNSIKLNKRSFIKKPAEGIIIVASLICVKTRGSTMSLNANTAKTDSI